MATAVGLNMKMTADTSGLGRGMTRAEKLLNGIDKNARSAARSLRVMATIQVGGALLKGLNSVSTALVGYVADVRQAAGEIRNFAQVSNSSADEFQRFAAAAGTVGIENQKLADIFKDVNDRIGDFLQTGGGPMADFFENVAPKVGVTVDQFRELSGPEALQLYVKTLQEANLSQQEFTFYMEAMASDATALIPLLQNGGEAFLEIANRAERLGIILSEDQVGAIVEMNNALTLVQKTFEGIIGQVVGNLAPVVTEMTEQFLGFVEAFEGLNGAQGGNAIADLITTTLLSGLSGFLEVVKVLGTSFLQFSEILGKVIAKIASYVGIDTRSDNERRLDELEDAGGPPVGWRTAATIAEYEKTVSELREQVAKEREGLDVGGIRDAFSSAIDAAQDAVTNIQDRLQDRGVSDASERANNESAAAERARDDAAEASLPQLELAEAEQERAKAAEEAAKAAQKAEEERQKAAEAAKKAEEDRKKAIEKADEAIAQAEEDRAKRAAEIEADRLDALSRRSTEALTVGDVRSGGISEVMRLATGREDPAVAESRKQLAQLQKIEQRIAELRADKVKIIGGAGRAA